MAKRICMSQTKGYQAGSLRAANQGLSWEIAMGKDSDRYKRGLTVQTWYMQVSSIFST
jgi:hypothetical protein